MPGVPPRYYFQMGSIAGGACSAAAGMLSAVVRPEQRSGGGELSGVFVFLGVVLVQVHIKLVFRLCKLLMAFALTTSQWERKM